MAGGTGEILLPRISESSVDCWRAIVSSSSHDQAERDFWVGTGCDSGDANPLLPFYWDVREENDDLWVFRDMPEASLAIQAAFGFHPGASIGFGAMCRGRPSDHIMGALVTEFLRRQNGVLLFHGLLSPSLDINEWRRWQGKTAVEQHAMFVATVNSSGGRVIAVPFDSPCYHAVDLAFLTGWIRHPAYHFVN